jgi:predicted Zn-dependent protease
VRLASLLLTTMLMPLLTTTASAQDSDETQMGAQVFQELKSKGEVVASSPLYAKLGPIARAITGIVQPQYPYPIHFYIVHESQPNAFAAPGGNVYVVDSLFTFVHDKEELAGTLCHETSHLLHRDAMKEMQHNEAIRRRSIAASILLGPSLGVVIATSALADLDSLHYSREQEESADLTGADTCAAAGINPWGLVWLFREFSNARLQTPPEVLSDHPDNADRIAALERHFSDNPPRFGRFSSNPRTATPLNIPKNEPETFLR